MGRRWARAVAVAGLAAAWAVAASTAAAASTLPDDQSHRPRIQLQLLLPPAPPTRGPLTVAYTFFSIPLDRDVTVHFDHVQLPY